LKKETAIAAVMLLVCAAGCTPGSNGDGEQAKPQELVVKSEIEPNNEMKEAMFSGPAIIHGAIEEDDDDWFCYSLPEKQTARFSFVVTGEGPLNFEIRNKAYEPLCESPAVAAGATVTHTLTGAKGGTLCYLHVYPGKEGAYTVKIQPVEVTAPDARN
jgi:hypothetical protein